MCAIKTLKSVGNEEPWTENEVVNTVQQQEREEEAVKTIFNRPEQKYGPAGGEADADGNLANQLLCLSIGRVTFKLHKSH